MMNEPTTDEPEERQTAETEPQEERNEISPFDLIRDALNRSAPLIKNAAVDPKIDLLTAEIVDADDESYGAAFYDDAGIIGMMLLEQVEDALNKLQTLVENAAAYYAVRADYEAEVDEAAKKNIELLAVKAWYNGAVKAHYETLKSAVAASISAGGSLPNSKAFHNIVSSMIELNQKKQAEYDDALEIAAESAAAQDDALREAITRHENAKEAFRNALSLYEDEAEEYRKAYQKKF